MTALLTACLLFEILVHVLQKHARKLCSATLNCFFISEDRAGQFHFNIPNTARQRIGSDLRYFFEVFLCWLAGFVVNDLHLNVGYNHRRPRRAVSEINL